MEVGNRVPKCPKFSMFKTETVMCTNAQFQYQITSKHKKFWCLSTN